MICPQCGAENAENAAFCSLCYATFLPAGKAGETGGAARALSDSHTADSGDISREPEAETAGEYVAPGDYRALARENAARGPRNGSAYSGYGESATAAGVPIYIRQRSRLDIAVMVLSYSFLTYIILFMSRFLVGMFLLGAAFGGSEAGFNFGLAMLFLADALVIVLGGYLISAKAMQAGRGWVYGIACAAAVVFLWQPLVSMIMVFLISGEVYVPIFSLVGILFTLFLELPMGALGGWLAEKRYMG